MSEERITGLEMKFSHQDDFIMQLNKIVTEQQVRIERLEKEMLELRKIADPENEVLNDRPPHY